MIRIFGLIILLCLSCNSHSIEETERRTEFAMAVVEDNILTTDFTALVEITGVSTEDVAQNSTGKDVEDLIAVRYTAKVLENYFGSANKSIVFTEYIEKADGLEGLSRGVLIVSLCEEKEGNYYLPDIGYELPAEDALIKEAQKVKALIQGNKRSLRKGEDYACK